MNQPKPNQASEPREQLDRALAFLRRALGFWRVAAVAVLVGELACVVFLLVTPPRYRSQTVLLYSEGIRSVETGEPAATPKGLAVRMQELLTARQLLQSVVEEFDLYSDVRQRQGVSDAIDELRRHIDFRAPGGDTFSISFEGVTPTQAHDVTARLAVLVIERDSNLRKKQASTARDFLAEEKKRASERLKDAEQELATFMALHPRFALDATPLATGAAFRASVAPTATLAGPRPRYVAVPAPKKESEPVPAPPAATVKAPSEAELAAQREAAAAVARAQAALAAAREDLNEKRTKYTDAHPDVRGARDAVARAQARLDIAAEKVVPVEAPAPAPKPSVPDGAPEKKSGTARRYVAVPAAPGAALPASTGPRAEDLVTQETDWARLTRAVTGSRQRLDQVEAQLFKADIASSSANVEHATPVTVIDPAFVPQRQVPPGPRTIAVIFFVLSCALGAFMAMVFAAFDDKIHDRRGAASLVEVLVEVPRLAKPRRARV